MGALADLAGTGTGTDTSTAPLTKGFSIMTDKTTTTTTPTPLSWAADAKPGDMLDASEYTEADIAEIKGALRAIDLKLVNGERGLEVAIVAI